MSLIMRHCLIAFHLFSHAMSSGASITPSKPMSVLDTVLGVIFLSQTGVGVLGNSFLCFYIFTLFSSRRARPMHVILAQLTMTNIIGLISRGFPEGVFFLQKGYLLGNLGCKMVFYVQRVSRGLSIGTTFLLSAFQAVTVSPSNSRLAKVKVQKLIRPSCVSLWIFNMILEINVPLYVTGPRSHNSSYTGGFDLLYCYWGKVSQGITILPSLRDILFVGGLVCSSGYIVFLLDRHHQRVQYIHSESLSSGTSPELKATETVLMLVSIFVCAYCISCGITLYKVYVTHLGVQVMNVGTFAALCFPTISPFLLIHRGAV
ncbi:vomeronasal 1 receptor monDomV1R1245 isoform X1 [Monodelphis domestica]|nr:vomeronasal 1 receptor monDomV1R1245 isoform X1 [Monodelphis domestica]